MNKKNYILIGVFCILINFIFGLDSDQTYNKSYSFLKDIYNDSWALIIGIDKYQNVPTLSYAAKDAIDVKELLIKKYGFKDSNVTLILDEEATKQNILSGFNQILKKAKANGL